MTALTFLSLHFQVSSRYSRASICHHSMPDLSLPANGYLEFYPDQLNRRDDACHANLNEVHEAIALRLRWGFAEGRQNVTPEDFANFSEINEKLKNTAEEHEAQTSLNRIYEACAHEASKLKRLRTVSGGNCIIWLAVVRTTTRNFTCANRWTHSS